MSIRRRSELVALALIASLFLGSSARAEADPLDEWRDRFKAGMERYRAGAIAEALAYWEPIYRELGPTKGYRLSYNLGIAYMEFGDATRSAERFESFVVEVEARRGRGEPLEPIVETEATEAHRRLTVLASTKGRIKVNVSPQPVAVKVDDADARIAGFVAYVAPGRHSITFRAGTKDAKAQTVDVKIGELVVITPPAPPDEPKRGDSVPDGMKIVRVRERPFSPVVLFVGGGLSLATIALPIVTYTRAANLRRTYNASLDPGERNNIENDYGSAKTLGYVSLAIPITLGVATAGLASWYFLGLREHDTLLPILAPTQNGAIAGLRGSF